MKQLILCIALLSAGLRASAIIYTPKDSVRVVRLLEEGKQQPQGTVLTLFYGRQFIDVPYVASTLEKDPDEQLVVNLHELDCSTFVETVLALTLTTQRSHSTSFKDYCYWLERIRYRNGIRNGYTSRNHYFSQWVRSNEQLGIISEQKGSTGNASPFTATQRIDLHYMSQHPAAYSMLRTDEQKLQIRTYEEEVNGTSVAYIPTSQLNLRLDKLSDIQDGDILALVTSKDGLDVSHQGIAVWGTDGKLHLLNASSIYHKVVLDNNTLFQYQTKRTTQLGVRVCRLKSE